jgi:internalin A
MRSAKCGRGSILSGMHPPGDRAMRDQTKLDNTAKRRHRWRQFGLRGLLLLVLLVAAGLFGYRWHFRAYLQQQRTMALIAKLGGSFETTEVNDRWLRLVGSTHNVSQVDLADCDDPDAYIAEIADLPAIELLAVGGPAFTDKHARQLHRLHSLRELILDSTSVSDEALADLRASLDDAAHPQDVYISQRRAIVALRKRGHVQVDHEKGPWHPPPMSGEWGEVATEFYATDHQFNDADSAYLKALPSLQILYLKYTALTDAGLENVKSLRQLQQLWLSGTRISDDGLKHVADLTQLRTLVLSDLQITDVGLQHLQSLPQLQRLVLSRTPVTDAGLEHLPTLIPLGTIELSETKVTPAGISKLKHARPNCRIDGPTYP